MYLRQKAGIPEEQLIDYSQLNIELHRNQERMKAKNTQLLREIERLEEERLDLKDELIQEAELRADRAAGLDLSERCQRILDEFITELRNKGEDAAPLNEKSMGLVSEVRKLKTQMRKLKTQNEALQSELEEAESELEDRVYEPEASSRSQRDQFEELIELIKRTQQQTGPAAAATPQHGGDGGTMPDSMPSNGGNEAATQELREARQ